ncbi:MAG: hypothetical protein IIZ92_30550 [Aquincola sp.]|nr:hypothetical protein [Aquincola sp.]
MKNKDPISCLVAFVGTVVLGVALAGLYRAVEAPQANAAPLVAPTVTAQPQPAAPGPVSQQTAAPAPRG